MHSRFEVTLQYRLAKTAIIVASECGPWSCVDTIVLAFPYLRCNF